MPPQPSSELTGSEPSPPTPPAQPLTFSFSGGGWFQMYHFGVGQALRDSGVIRDDTRYVGTSAGSLAVAAMAGECDFNEMREFSLTCAEHCRGRWWRMFFLKDYLHRSIHKFGDGPLAEKSPAGTTSRQDSLREKVEVYATVLPSFEPRAFREFADIDDVVEAISASCCMAPVVGLPFRLRKTGEWVCDGGLTAFQPRSGEPGVTTISPFYFTSADIRPSSFLPFWWAIRPPKAGQYNAVFDAAYNDAIRYVVSAHLAPPSTIKLLREVEAPRRRFPVLIDMSVFFLYAMLRPLTMLFVCIELMILVCWNGLFALFKSSDRSVLLTDMIKSGMKSISIASFAHFAFHIVGMLLPLNEPKMFKRSLLYRVFKPWIFEPTRR